MALADREVTREQFQRFMDDADAEKPLVREGATIEYSPTEQHPVQWVTSTYSLGRFARLRSADPSSRL